MKFKEFFTHPAAVFLAGMTLVGIAIELRSLTLGLFSVGLVIVSVGILIARGGTSNY
jgi:hypothetical protein